MPTAVAGNTGMTLCYETFGNPEHPALLLIMGISSQMIHWDDAFCRMLSDRGFFVIRFDNRDCGLSTKLGMVPVHVSPRVVADLARSRRGIPIRAPYQLSEMADDCAGLLEALGIRRAHVVGTSMGGMIAQEFAIGHPDRVISLASMRASTGDVDVGRSSARVQAALLWRAFAKSREAVVRRTVRVDMLLAAGHRTPYELLTRNERLYDRSYCPEGELRQMLAILAAPSRTAKLMRLRVPTVVIHGDADLLVDISGGRRTAAAVPGARLVVLQGMGHDNSPPFWPAVIDAIESNSRRANLDIAV